MFNYNSRHECRSSAFCAFLCAVVVVFNMVAFRAVAQTQLPLPFSQRIGNTIDNTERAYFNLFPNITSFHTAIVQREVDTTIITINRTSAPDTILGLTTEASELLAMWIDEHEDVYRENRALNWSILWKYTTPDQPFDEGEEVTVTDIFGNIYNGDVVYADDSTLFLLPIDSVYNWRSLDNLLLSFNATSIVRVQTSNAAYQGLGAGIAIGAIGSMIISRENNSNNLTREILTPIPLMILPYVGEWIGEEFFGMDADIRSGKTEYRTLQSLLSKRSYFRRIPPELRNSRTERRPPLAVRLMKREPEQNQKEPLPDERLHILAATGTGSGRIGTYEVNVVGRFTDYEVRSGTDFTLMAARYNFFPLVGFGGVYLQNNELSIDSAGTEFMNLSASGFTVDLTVRPVNLPILRMLSLGFGGGVGTVRMQGGGSVRCPFGYCDDHVDYSYDESRPAYFVNAGGDIHITDFISFHYRIQYLTTSEITVLEDREIVLSSTIGPVLRMKEHTVNPTFHTTMVGVQFHL